MANVTISTGLAKELLARQSLKEALANTVLEIFSGVMPSSADAAETGTKLVRITVNGATFSGDVAPIKAFKITAAGDVNDTITVTLTPTTPSGTAETFQVTRTSSEDTPTKLAIKVCAAITAGCSFAVAVPSTDDTAGVVSIMGKVPGDDFSVAVAVTGNITKTDPVTVVSAVRGTGLHYELFQTVTEAKLEKYPDEVWKGLVLASGVASWFRIKDPNDTGGVSTTAKRIQGAVGTLPGVALLLAGTASLTKDTEVVIGQLNISLPLS